MDFAGRLKQLREEKGLNRAECATVLGLTPAGYGNYELDKTFPNKDLLIQIAQFYNVSVDYLLGITDIKESNRSYLIDNLPPDAVASLTDYSNFLKSKYSDK